MSATEFSTINIWDTLWWQTDVPDTITYLTMLSSLLSEKSPMKQTRRLVMLCFVVIISAVNHEDLSEIKGTKSQQNTTNPEFLGMPVLFDNILIWMLCRLSFNFGVLIE